MLLKPFLLDFRFVIGQHIFTKSILFNAQHKDSRIWPVWILAETTQQLFFFPFQLLLSLLVHSPAARPVE